MQLKIVFHMLQFRLDGHQRLADMRHIAIVPGQAQYRFLDQRVLGWLHGIDQVQRIQHKVGLHLLGQVADAGAFVFQLGFINAGTRVGNGFNGLIELPVQLVKFIRSGVFRYPVSGVSLVDFVNSMG